MMETENSQPLYEKKLQIYFGDCDPQGILFAPKIYELSHNVLEEFWSQSKLGWSYWFNNPEFAVPIRHSACEYFAPLRVGESYLAQLRLKNLGESSVEFHFEFISAQDHSVVYADVTTVHVFVDRKKFKKATVPQSVKDYLNKN